MPLTATHEDIKAYQEKVEKNQITPNDLGRCPRCYLEAVAFKFHAYRERRFLIIAEMIVKAVYCSLIRFMCTGCGKTITYYPGFAIPHKHYTRQTIVNYSSNYVTDDQKTYQSAIMTEDAVPERSDSGRALSPSTLHRWISTLAALYIGYKKDSADKRRSYSQHDAINHLEISPRKYKTIQRQECLLRCRQYLRTNSFCINQLSPSLQ